MPPSCSILGRKSAIVLGEALNEAFTYQLQLSYEPLRLERVVAGDDLYDFLITRGYTESFCDYMRTLRGPRAVKDGIIRIQTGSLWTATADTVDRHKLGQELLVQLACDFLNSPKHRQPYFKPSCVEPLIEALREDGYAFEGGKLTPLPHVAAISQARQSLEGAGGDHLHRHLQRMLDALEDDPEQALGSAKELLESVCKTILAERGALPESSVDLPDLVKLVRGQLELVPASADDATRGREIVRRVVSSMSSIIQGLGELRGLYGTGHGRNGGSEGLALRHARLAAGSAAALASFLWESHKEQPP